MPLVDNAARDYTAGWTTSGTASTLIDSPEVEIFCGGINTKGPNYAAIWRQGNLLHFGFEQSPSEMNVTGKALLVNSIAYISRFTEDRPIPVTPTVFVTQAYPRSRESVDQLLDHGPSDYLKYYLSKEVERSQSVSDVKAFRRWWADNRGFLHANSEGLLAIDEEARRFGVSFSSSDFFPRAISTLNQAGSGAASARALLARYAPGGPGASATAAEWTQWWDANKEYLFFSDSGGFRWYLDPLAKKRGIPTSRLRGAARASLPDISPVK